MKHKHDEVGGGGGHRRRADGEDKLWGLGKRTLTLALAITMFTIALGASLALGASAPIISNVRTGEVTKSTAVLMGTVNPSGRQTTFHFELIDQAGFEAGGFAGATNLPTPSPSIGADTEDVGVVAEASGLSPATAYRFRLVASNTLGTTIGAEGTFTTLEPCENDALRPGHSAALADCRAYEQVSPLDKNAGDVTGAVALVKAAAGGNGVTFASNAGFPGGEGEQALPFYLASRSTSGWSTQGLLPAASTGQRAHVLGWTPEITEAFDTATQFGTPPKTALLARSSNGGGLTQIAPYANTDYNFAGSANGGELAFFESSRALVPGAVEGHSNVYLWNRSSKELSLASALNSSQAPPEGAFAGPYDWVSGTSEATVGKGGALSGYYTQDDHAISTDGSALYFTAAGTGQLYLRRNLGKEQSPLSAGKCSDPAKACTVQVSESRKNNGKGPGGKDVLGQRPAAFLGASADGFTAFFTSSEKLTNDANTGPEPGPAAISRAGLKGESPEPEFFLHKALRLAAGGGFIYWVDPAAKTIGRAKLNGAGSVSEVDDEYIGSGLGDPQWIALDGTHIYWTNRGAEGKDGEGSIGRAKLGALKGEEVKAQFIAGEIEDSPGHFVAIVSDPRGIAVDGEHIYWGNNGSKNLTQGIGRADLDGNPTSVKQPWTVDAEGNPFGFTSAGLALDSTYLYFTRAFDGNIERVELADPNHFDQILPIGTSDKFEGLAVSGSHIYWANRAGSEVGRAKLNPYPQAVSEVEANLIEEAGHPEGLALDGEHVYWTANQEAAANPGNDLYRYEAKTDTLSDLSVDTGDKNGAEVKGVVGMSEDGSYLYFVANGDLDGAGGASGGDCQGSRIASTTGSCNLYLRHGETTSFIARLEASTSPEKTDAANWTGKPNVFESSDSFQKTASVSADGRVLLFRSQRQLTPYDSKGTPELYRYDDTAAPGQRLLCVSCNPSGAPPGGAPSLGSILPAALGNLAPLATRSRNFAAGGDRVFFETTDSLLGADTNAKGGCPPGLRGIPVCQDVYEWEANGVGSCHSEAQDGGCLSLLSTGKSSEPSFFADASASGGDAFVITRERLVGQDEDELYDVYDARAGGGLAAQSPAKPPPCEGVDACHGPLSPPQSFAQPGTESFRGPGDPKPKRQAKHGKRRRGHHHRRGRRGAAQARPLASASQVATASAVQSAAPGAVPAQPVAPRSAVAPQASAPIAAAAPLTPTPAWKLTVSSQPTNFPPGVSSGVEYLLVATNVGAAETSGPITLKDTLPKGLSPGTQGSSCSVAEQTVSCSTPGPVYPGKHVYFVIPVKVDPLLAEGSVLTDVAKAEGGGAATAQASTETTISASPPPFGILGLDAPLGEADGTPATQAGSHPYQLSVGIGFPTVRPASALTGSGNPRDITVELPRGLLGDPAATPVLCTEAELVTQGEPGCPEAAAVGTVTATTVTGGTIPESSPLFNMVPPPGAPAAFGTDIAGAGIFVHVIGAVRTDGDYGVDGSSHDILAIGTNPVIDVHAELWGDPSSATHDHARGECAFPGAIKTLCPVDPQSTAFLTLPSDCPGTPSVTRALADGWEQPGVFAQASYESADLGGAVHTHTEDCAALEFKPTIKAQPTTDVADSPTGLDFELKQPQETDLKGTATANLKDVSLTFPAGLTVNASSGDGLGACTAAQIGLATAVGESPAHFSRQLASCPNAAKIGTVEVTSPLLAQHNEKHEVQRDPETGEAIPEPLHGSVYLAKPFENPFGSLIAIYLTIEDPKTGIFAKLASEVEPDPVTGQLRTTLTEAPELPVADFKVHIFDGARAGLQTPPACGTYTTTANLTPWSAPEAPAASVEDSFQTATAPDGSPCPSSEAGEPHAPTFSAGTLSPAAAKYSPMALRVGRKDGSQRLAGLEVTLPPGLTARLAGVAECSEAQIAGAKGREVPQQGALEQANPSCPAASEVGSVTVGAGAGPSPLYVHGHAYLAGPYKGAPLSLVAIVPAVAGPFDLGTVVSRAAIYLDPISGQPRAVSDPFPQILHGIPADVRTVAIHADRPRFTLNPTSCDEESFTGKATSALGQIVPLSARFQVGGCKALAFKPKLSARLFGPIHRGGHPRFRAVLTAKPGEANIASFSMTLPHSEFIDQGHFRTICTRVQFTAGQCPAGSIYGHVKAITPLLDYPLQGPVYLRSSTHQLPDAVAALRGPPNQPIEIDAVARIDSVNGRLRSRVETVPDAPISKVIVSLQGGRKGLFQNSTNICKGAHPLSASFIGQNGKAHEITPELSAQCGGKGKRKAKPGGRRR